MSVEKDRREKNVKNLAGIFKLHVFLFLGKVTQSPLIKAAYSLENIIVLISLASVS